MILTGQQLVEQGIILNGVDFKVDDGELPSYGVDGCGYTLCACVAWDYQKWVLEIGGTIEFQSLEMVDIPTDCVGICYLKTTYGRQGIISTLSGVLDPGFQGPVTIRLYNSSNYPVTLYSAGGFVMVMVQQLTERATGYSGRWM